MNIQDLIANQKSFLLTQLTPTVEELAHTLSVVDNTMNEYIDTMLFDFVKNNDFINVAYLLDNHLYQVSSNITRRHIKPEFIGQDLSSRPFLENFSSEVPYYLTDSYISTVTLKPCISFVYGIKNEHTQLFNVLVLDLDLIKLPLLISHFATQGVEQMRGDKAIRSQLFNQVRKTSKLDENIVKAHEVVHKLVVNFGVFHIKLHYSASRATIWQYKDPYRYVVISIDELLNDNIYLLFPQQEYPSDATIKMQDISLILDNLKYLRFMDENMYLRAGSFNIMNGTIGVNFSCDGYHYMQSNEFLNNFDKLYA